MARSRKTRNPSKYVSKKEALKANGTLKKGYRYAGGGKIVKV